MRLGIGGEIAHEIKTHFLGKKKLIKNLCAPIEKTNNSHPKKKSSYV
jgi:hypothetical protein